MKKTLAFALLLSALTISACAAITPESPAASQSHAAPASTIPSGPIPAPNQSAGTGTPSASAMSVTQKASPTATVSASAAPKSPSPEAGVPAASAPATSSPPSGVPGSEKNVITLEGKVGTFSVHMTLSIKDGAVTGTYYYDNPEHDLKLAGTVEVNRMLMMKETDAGGTVTGTFDGYYVPGLRLAGLWKNAKTNEQLDFSLDVVNGIPKDAVWSGEWRRLDTGRFASADLIIYDETKTGFNFQLEAFNGANMGMLEGPAVISGMSAVYRDSATGAVLSFSIKDGLLMLEANDAANGQAGAGVVFGGRYTKNALPVDTLLSVGYVTTKAQDDAFWAMTGKDYDLFLNTANLREDAKDLDGLGATVYTWWVHGFKGTNESIVMFLTGGKLCAAVIDPERDIVRVFTNDPSITAVPKTIQAWIDSLHQQSVQFYGAKA